MNSLLKDRTPNQLVGLAFGAVYLLVGAAGFLVTGGVGFAEAQGATLIAFDVNPLHNVVHLAVGALLTGAALSGSRDARLMNASVGTVYLVVAVAGLFVVRGSAHPLAERGFSGLLGGNPANVLALNQADNVLHVLSAAVLIGAAVLWRGRGTGSDEEVNDEPESASASDAVEIEIPLDARVPGDIAVGAGQFRCSCQDFGVYLRKGVAFPQCPQDDGAHYYMPETLPRTRAKARVA